MKVLLATCGPCSKRMLKIISKSWCIGLGGVGGGSRSLFSKGKEEERREREEEDRFLYKGNKFILVFYYLYMFKCKESNLEEAEDSHQSKGKMQAREARERPMEGIRRTEAIVRELLLRDLVSTDI